MIWVLSNLRSLLAKAAYCMILLDILKIGENMKTVKVLLIAR